MVVDVAVEHPSARILGNHIDGQHLRLHEFDDIRALSILEDHVVVPVRKSIADLLFKESLDGCVAIQILGA